MTDKKHYIYTTERYCGRATLTAPGLYAVRFGRRLPQRALAIKHHAGKYSVYLDGVPQAEASTLWTQAFGPIFDSNPDCLIGRPIEAEEYKNLIYFRNMDILRGVDLSKPSPSIHESMVAL